MKPVLALTMGDFNGIGPEVALKCTLAPGISKICTPVLVGARDVFDFYIRRLKLNITLERFDNVPWRSKPGTAALAELKSQPGLKIRPGIPSVEAARYAGDAIRQAVSLWSADEVDGIVTAPTSKDMMNKAGFRYPGQTEMVAALSGGAKPTMMLIAGTFRIALATVHLPHREVAEHLSQQGLVQKLVSINTTLRKDFSIKQPTIAILGLNPHAGEHGLLGSEETKILLPAILQARKMRIKVTGPFPADGFFGTHSHMKFDAVLAMYHDQGLIPLKMSGFNIGVNFSAGLPIVRTSPDHGTAYEIAGKGIADPSSMIEAITLAVTIIHNRRAKS